MLTSSSQLINPLVVINCSHAIQLNHKYLGAYSIVKGCGDVWYLISLRYQNAQLFQLKSVHSRYKNQSDFTINVYTCFVLLNFRNVRTCVKLDTLNKSPTIVRSVTRGFPVFSVPPDFKGTEFLALWACKLDFPSMNKKKKSFLDFVLVQLFS